MCIRDRYVVLFFHLCIDGGIAVFVVSGNGVADGSQMGADLVGSSRYQRYL